MTFLSPKACVPDVAGVTAATNRLLGLVTSAIDDSLRQRAPAGRNQQEDDRLLSPASNAMYVAMRGGQPAIAARILREAWPLARAYEKKTGTEIHKGAIAFNGAVALLRLNDLAAAFHFFEVAANEDRLTSGATHWDLFTSDIFQAQFWAVVTAAENQCPNVAYSALWGWRLEGPTALGDWQALSSSE